LDSFVDGVFISTIKNWTKQLRNQNVSWWWNQDH